MASLGRPVSPSAQVVSTELAMSGPGSQVELAQSVALLGQAGLVEQVSQMELAKVERASPMGQVNSVESARPMEVARKARPSRTA